MDLCQGIYDLPPNASSALKALEQRTAAANAKHPSVFSLHEYLRPGSLGYTSLEGTQLLPKPDPNAKSKSKSKPIPKINHNRVPNPSHNF